MRVRVRVRVRDCLTLTRSLPLSLSTPAQAAQLRGVDAVGARLQREADDLAARNLVGRLVQVRVRVRVGVGSLIGLVGRLGRGRVGVRVRVRVRVIGLVGRLLLLERFAWPLLALPG